MGYKLLIETSNPADVALIKSLLDAEGILYFVQGEAFSAVRPLVDPVRILVAEDRLDEAEALLGGLPFFDGSAVPPDQKDAEEANDD